MKKKLYNYASIRQFKIKKKRNNKEIIKKKNLNKKNTH